MNNDIIISFDWETKTTENTERIGVMYCFRHCDVNYN